MRIVIALGGNALLRRGQPMTAENQRDNIRVAAECIAAITPGNEIVVAHGNGPQVGLLALQAAAYQDVAPYPLDILGAQTDAMIGYVIEQELGNLLPAEQSLATILTMIEVDRDDPAFSHPTKPIGPVYDRQAAERLQAAFGWAIAADGDQFRRVVASPKPKRIFEIRPILASVDVDAVDVGGDDQQVRVELLGPAAPRPGPCPSPPRRRAARRPRRHVGIRRHRRRSRRPARPGTGSVELEDARGPGGHDAAVGSPSAARPSRRRRDAPRLSFCRRGRSTWSGG